MAQNDGNKERAHNPKPIPDPSHQASSSYSDSRSFLPDISAHFTVVFPIKLLRESLPQSLFTVNLQNWVGESHLQCVIEACRLVDLIILFPTSKASPAFTSVLHPIHRLSSLSETTILRVKTQE
ncbi:hypothetical protein Droror1_Dr00020142 [Drosera rotundifolia]